MFMSRKWMRTDYDAKKTIEAYELLNRFKLLDRGEWIISHTSNPQEFHNQNKNLFHEYMYRPKQFNQMNIWLWKNVRASKMMLMMMMTFQINISFRFDHLICWFKRFQSHATNTMHLNKQISEMNVTENRCSRYFRKVFLFSGRTDWKGYNECMLRHDCSDNDSKCQFQVVCTLFKRQRNRVKWNRPHYKFISIKFLCRIISFKVATRIDTNCK